MDLEGKVVVVTGGGNGIGRQVVLELLRRGARMAAVDIRQESLDETIGLAATGDRLVTVVADITDRNATESLPTKVVDALGTPISSGADCDPLNPGVEPVPVTRPPSG